MNCKMKEAINMYSTLDKLSKTTCPFRVTYWVTKNIHALSPTFEAFSKERDLIYADCLYKDKDGYIAHKNENGDYVFNVKEDKKEEWIKRFDELDKFDVEFEPYLLDIDKLMESDPDFKIEPQLMTALMPLIKF